MANELTDYLESLNRDACFRVDAVLKQSDFETTQRVFFVGKNGAEAGPFVRKRFPAKAGFGTAYDRIFGAQRNGRRFLFLPHIIDCYDMDSDHVVIMEHVAGMTLGEYVRFHQPSLELAAQVFPLLCAAVSELHEAFAPPIIHRDLKPSNVIVTPEVAAGEDGSATNEASGFGSSAESKSRTSSGSASNPASPSIASTPTATAPSLTIIDFGIARTYHDGAEEDTRHFGTRAWAPPEQFGFRQTDVRSDVYALGLLLYFCLTGKTPDAHAQKLAYADPAYAEPLRRVIAQATAFDPGNRYASARELHDAFLEALATCDLSVHDDDDAPGNADVNEGLQNGPQRTWHATPRNATQDEAPSATPDVSAASTQNETQHTPQGYSQVAALDHTQIAAGSEPQDAPHANEPNAKPPRSRAAAVLTLFRNIGAALVFLVFFAACTDLIFNPQPDNYRADAPMLTRVRAYYGILFLIMGPCLYLIADRRPLKERFPAFARISTLHEVLVCIALIIIGFVVIGTA